MTGKKSSLRLFSTFIMRRASLFTYNNCILFALIWGWTHQPVAEGRYRCTLKDFIRLGNSCYFLSTEISSWQEAHFRCRDRGAQLAVLASHYEDSTLRSYLERPEFAQLGRWIGGMWAGSKWIWAAQGAEIENEESFANKDVLDLNDTDQWMCLFMDPNSRYRWSNENCMLHLHYICEAPLARISSNATSINGDSAIVTNSTTVNNNDTAPSSFDLDASENKTENEAGLDLISETVEEITLSTTPIPAVAEMDA